MDAWLSTIQTYVAGPTLLWLAATSLFMFLGTLVAIPFILVRLPANYFTDEASHEWLQNAHPALRVVLHVGKNILGFIFFLAGFAMLFLPGQGVLTMLIGISLMDFPGKRTLERRMIGQPTVLSTINKMREKFGAPPLVL